MAAEEEVLVVARSLLDDLGSFQGFSAEADRYLSVLLAPEHLQFLPRGQAEDDPRFKQLIPYVLLQHGDHWFCYRRGGGQGERRLHAKLSLGIGGHISREDAAGGTDLYETGMHREVAEEVVIAARYRSRRLGLINDDATEVGRVHLGIVHVFELDEPSVTAREADILEPQFVDRTWLAAHTEELESWSQICLQVLE